MGSCRVGICLPCGVGLLAPAAAATRRHGGVAHGRVLPAPHRPMLQPAPAVGFTACILLRRSAQPRWLRYKAARMAALQGDVEALLIRSDESEGGSGVGLVACELRTLDRSHTRLAFTGKLPTLGQAGLHLLRDVLPSAVTHGPTCQPPLRPSSRILSGHVRECPNPRRAGGTAARSAASGPLRRGRAAALPGPALWPSRLVCHAGPRARAGDAF